MRIVLFSFLILSLLSAKEMKREGFSLGVTAALKNSLFKDIDTKQKAFPMFGYRSQYFYFRGIEAGVIPYKEEGTTIKLFLTYELSFSRKGSDSLALSGTNQRKGALLGGIEVDRRLIFSLLSLKAGYDLSNIHNGYFTRLYFKQRIKLSSFFLLSHIGLSYYDASYANYYFGIKESESSDTRHTFRVGELLSRDIGLMLRYPLTQKTALMTGVKYAFFDKKIKRSDIITTSLEKGVVLGMHYRF